MDEVNYPPYSLIWVNYDVLKRVLESGRYDINKTHYTRVNGHDNRTLLSFWSEERVKIDKLKLILSFNPDKTHYHNKRIYSEYGPPLFHITAQLSYGFYASENTDQRIDEAYEKLRLILQDGYDYSFKDPRTGMNLIQYYRDKTDDYINRCWKWTKQDKCACIPCKTAKLYSSLAQVVQECWIKDVTLFSIMINHCDISNKKQRRK